MGFSVFKNLPNFQMVQLVNFDSSFLCFLWWRYIWYYIFYTYLQIAELFWRLAVIRMIIYELIYMVHVHVLKVPNIVNILFLCNIIWSTNVIYGYRFLLSLKWRFDVLPCVCMSQWQIYLTHPFMDIWKYNCIYIYMYYTIICIFFFGLRHL